MTAPSKEYQIMKNCQGGAVIYKIKVMSKNEAEQLNFKEADIDQNQSVAGRRVNKHLFISG